MIETKLINIWQIESYTVKGWMQISAPSEGKVLMQRINLIKGVANVVLSSI